MVIYQKADKNGPVAGTVPDDLETVRLDYATDGLNDNDIYWSAFCYSQPSNDKPFLLLSGFILQDDLDFSG